MKNVLHSGYAKIYNRMEKIYNFERNGTSK